MYRIRGQQMIEQQVAQTGAYVDPLSTLPHIDEPELNTMFKARVPQMIDRAKSLVSLAELSIIEDGAPSITTDYWLAVARQNIRDPKVGEVHYSTEAQATLGLIGLKALYLDSDTSRRDGTEAYVYNARAAKASQDIESGDYFGKPQTNPFMEALNELDAVDEANLGLDGYIALIGEHLGLKQHSPELAQAKSRALFDFASTIADCPEKKDTLNEALLYANHAFTNAKDMATKGKALRILASALHDISYMANSFSDDVKKNAKLVPEARNYAVILLHESAEELELAIREGQDLTGLQPVLDEARYFETLYGQHVQEQGIYMPTTPEIRRHIANETAKKFGSKLVLYALPSANEAEQALVA